MGIHNGNWHILCWVFSLLALPYVSTQVSDTGDVPEMTGGGQRMSPKVG